MWGSQIIPKAVFAFQALQELWKAQVEYPLLTYFLAVVGSHTVKRKFYADNLTWNGHNDTLEELCIPYSYHLRCSQGCLRAAAVLGRSQGYTQD